VKDGVDPKPGDVIQRALRETLTDWHLERRTARSRGAWILRAAGAVVALVRVVVASLLAPDPSPDPLQEADARRGWSDAMITDLRLAARSLWRSPWFTSTAVATIALSMVLASTTFAVVDGVLFKPLPYPQADRLFRVHGAMNRRGAERMSFSGRDLDNWRTVPGVRIATFEATPREIGGLGDSTRSLKLASVDQDFFDVLGQRPMIGGFRPEDFEAAPNAPRGLLLTHRLWRTAFGGDPSVIGRPVASSQAFAMYVAGVLPRDFLFPAPIGREVPDAILPIVRRAEVSGTLRINTLTGIARLEPGVEAAATRQALTAVAQAHRGDVRARDAQPAGFEKVTFEALVDVLGRFERKGFRLALAASLGLVLLACLNVAGLVAARGRERVRELSLRVALGARRRDLVRLLVLESALLGLAGGALGAGLTWPALGGVSALLPTTVVYLKTLAVDVRVVVFALAAGVISVVLMTLPAVVTSMRAGLRDRLAGGGGTTMRARTAGRFALIATQAALGMVLVLGGALLFASFLQLAREDHGFALDHTARLALNSPRLADLLAEVRRMPGVVAAAATDAHIMQGGHYEIGYKLPPRPGIGTNGARVTAGYFDVAGVRLVDGRLPTEEEVAARRPVAVISDILARTAWPGQNVIGQIVKESPEFPQIGDLTIIGVVTDTRLQRLDEASPSGEIYLPLPEPTRLARFTVLIRTSQDPDLVAAAVARRLRVWDSRVSILAAESLRASVWGSVKPRTFDAVLYGSLASAALVLVAVGIAGLVATTVARRQREIGIRMALGADRRRVRRLIVGETIRPVIVGLVAGAIASYWTTALVEASLYGTSPHDRTAWAATMLMVLAAAAIAAYVPARRASQVDPVSVLRGD
jgi:putative ABC transport system permease protein